MKNDTRVKFLLLAALCTFVTTACQTTFTVEQSDISKERAITSKVKGTAYGSGKQTLQTLKTLQTDKTQSTGFTGLDNQGPTNTFGVDMLRELRGLAEALHPVPK